MLLSLKTKSVPHGARTVPNGGLGGCVVVSPSHTVSDSAWEGVDSCRSDERPNRSPDYDIRPVQRAGNALRLRLDAPLPTTPAAPRHPCDLSVEIAREDGARQWRGKPYWSPNEETRYTIKNLSLNTISSPTCKTPPMPVELPGSLLLPSQGFQQTDPPCTPPRSGGEFRSNGSESSLDTIPSLTNSCTSSPETGSYSPSSLRSNLNKSLPALPFGDDQLAYRPKSTQITLPVARSAYALSEPFTSLYAYELLQLLPNLYDEEPARNWIASMEQELSRLRNWIAYELDEPSTSLVALNRFYKENLKDALKSALQISQTHDPTFRRVQESFTPDHQSHAVSLQQTQTKIHSMLTRLHDKEILHMPINRPNELDVLTTFDRAIATISKFIQSQLIYQLRQHPRGLSADLTDRLRTFDQVHRPHNHHDPGPSNRNNIAPSIRTATRRLHDSPPQTTPNRTQIHLRTLEQRLQHTQHLLRATQATLMSSYDTLQNTSRHYDEAVALVDRYQAKLDGFHEEIGEIRNKLGGSPRDGAGTGIVGWMGHGYSGNKRSGIGNGSEGGVGGKYGQMSLMSAQRNKVTRGQDLNTSASTSIATARHQQRPRDTNRRTHPNVPDSFNPYRSASTTSTPPLTSITQSSPVQNYTDTRIALTRIDTFQSDVQSQQIQPTLRATDFKPRETVHLLSRPNTRTTMTTPTKIRLNEQSRRYIPPTITTATSAGIDSTPSGTSSQIPTPIHIHNINPAPADTTRDTQATHQTQTQTQSRTRIQTRSRSGMRRLKSRIGMRLHLHLLPQ